MSELVRVVVMVKYVMIFYYNTMLNYKQIILFHGKEMCNLQEGHNGKFGKYLGT